jgi:predicted TIM-barrel fold metal-dependent hydrolase
LLKVDCHTHWGRSWRQRDGEDPSPWLAITARYGVTHAIVLPHQGLENAGAIREEHDHLARVCARSGGRMLPFCTGCAWETDAPVEVRRCLATLGFRGIKFHPWLQGCSVSSPMMDQIAELAGEFDVPMLFHDGTPPFSLPSQMALLAQRHPGTKIILGHSGLFEHYREAAAAVNACDNLWACLCGPHVQGLRHLLARVPVQRLLWGTDFGYSLADVFAYRDALTDLLNLSDGQRRAMFQDNPASLLRLQRQG